MASCNKCSAKLLPDQQVCSACGEPVPEPGAEAPDTLIGQVIAGKFEVGDPIGEGAMGRVYRAKQLSLDKQVAIKVLHKHLAMDPKVSKRFHREARAASRLSHPNSLQMIDFGRDDDGTLFIAMELLEGHDLLTVIEDESPMSPARIADIMKQVLLALDEAHHKGIIHRDLKPENVIVVKGRGGAGDLVKVCDFGIAKIQEHEGGSSVTVTGFVCGTPEYMAPEQARGEELDRRADIYACGVMLYQLLTGSVPFLAESALGIITKHLTENAVPPRQRRPDLHIPESFEVACMRAMSKDRERRYATAAEMNDALERAVAELGSLAHEPLGTPDPNAATLEVTSPTTASQAAMIAKVDGRGSRWPVWAAAAAGVLLVGGIAAYAVGGAGDDDGGEPIATAGDGTAGGVATPPIADPPVDGGPREVVVTPPSSADAGRAAVGPDRGTPPGKRGPRGRDRDRDRQAGQGTPPPDPTPPDRPPPPEPTPEQSPGELAYEEGRRLFLSNNVSGAIQRFEEAARHMPRNAQVHKQLGRAYMRAGNVSRSVSSYRRYLELQPSASDRAIIERIIAQSGGG